MVDVLPIYPEISQEGDSLRVAEEKGRFVIRREGIPVCRAFTGGDPKHDLEPIALGAHGAARWGSRSGTGHSQ